MNIGLLIFVAVGLIALVVVVAIARACFFISKKEYVKALTILKRIPQDPSNAISPVDLALMAVKTNELELAQKLLHDDIDKGMHPVHLTLQILLFAQKNDWKAAQDSYELLHNLMVRQKDVNNQDMIDLDKIGKSIKDKNLNTLRNVKIYKELERSLQQRARSLLTSVLFIITIGAFVCVVWYVIEL